MHILNPMLEDGYFWRIDMLQRSHHMIVSGCLLCLWNAEDVRRLFIHSSFSSCVWNAILERFGIVWVMS